MRLYTGLCDLLRIDVPILSAPMGPSISSPELAAAVSNAGGLGMISFGGDPAPLLRQKIEQIKRLTSRPFGVNFLVGLPFPIDEQLAVCADTGVPVVSFYWGDATPYIKTAQAAGLLTMVQVGTLEAGRRAAAAGADVVIGQGAEAGGHVAGTVSTLVLLPLLCDAVAPLPVVAAGGIGDGRGLAAALVLGAQGALVGTAFLATPEANAHSVYKQNILSATEEDTVLTTLFGGGWPNAPHRTLRSAFVQEWLAAEERGSEQRADEPIIGETSFRGQRVPVKRFAAMPPEASTAGAIESMAMLAGQSVAFVREIRPAADVVASMVKEAEASLRNVYVTLTSPAPISK